MVTFIITKIFPLLDPGDGELAVEQVHEAFKAMNAFPHLTHDQLSQVGNNRSGEILMAGRRRKYAYSLVRRFFESDQH